MPCFLLRTTTGVKCSCCVLLTLHPCQWSCPRRPSARASSSLTVFMELCSVVGVVPRFSPRPCKEPHRGAARPHRAPTTIPENPTCVEQQQQQEHVGAADLCVGPNGTSERDGWSCWGFSVASNWKQFKGQMIMVTLLLKQNVSWLQSDLAKNV